MLEIPTGVFADAFGRRKAMILAFTSYIFSFLIFFFFVFLYLHLGHGPFWFRGGFSFWNPQSPDFRTSRDQRHARFKSRVLWPHPRGFPIRLAVNSLIAAGLLFFTGDYRAMFLATTIPYVIDLINVATYPKILDGELAQLKRGAIWQQSKVTLKISLAYLPIDGHYGRYSIVRAFPPCSNRPKITCSRFWKPWLWLDHLLLIDLDDVERSGVVVGVVYFFIYLLTSYASRNADHFSRRFDGLAKAVNLTFYWAAISFCSRPGNLAESGAHLGLRVLGFLRTSKFTQTDERGLYQRSDIS